MICSHFDIKTEIDQITPIFVPFKFNISEIDCKSMLVSVYLKNIVQKDRCIQGSSKFSISYIVFLQGSGYWTFPQQGGSELRSLWTYQCQLLQLLIIFVQWNAVMLKVIYSAIQEQYNNGA